MASSNRELRQPRNYWSQRSKKTGSEESSTQPIRWKAKPNPRSPTQLNGNHDDDQARTTSVGSPTCPTTASLTCSLTDSPSHSGAGTSPSREQEDQEPITVPKPTPQTGIHQPRLLSPAPTLPAPTPSALSSPPRVSHSGPSLPNTPRDPPTRELAEQLDKEAAVVATKKDILHCTLRLTRADHHHRFLTDCKESNTVPKGLTLEKSINLMDGPDKVDAQSAFHSILTQTSLEIVNLLIDYYADLLNTEQERLNDLNKKLTELEGPEPNEEDNDFREHVTKRQNRLAEQLSNKRDNKSKALKNPRPRQTSQRKPTVGRNASTNKGTANRQNNSNGSRTARTSQQADPRPHPTTRKQQQPRTRSGNNGRRRRPPFRQMGDGHRPPPNSNNQPLPVPPSRPSIPRQTLQPQRPAPRRLPPLLPIPPPMHPLRMPAPAGLATWNPVMALLTLAAGQLQHQTSTWGYPRAVSRT